MITFVKKKRTNFLLHSPFLYDKITFVRVNAGMSEWQTMQTQNLLGASPCGFKSHCRHYLINALKSSNSLKLPGFKGFLFASFLSVFCQN